MVLLYLNLFLKLGVLEIKPEKLASSLIVNIFGTKITEIIFKGNTKYFRDGAFRMKLCLYILL